MNQLHKELLSILDDFIEICNKHKIKYQLAYGSAIGAVRENGFIPWDDDIDIVMTRDNYEKFIKVTKGMTDENLNIGSWLNYPKRNIGGLLRIYKKTSNFSGSNKKWDLRHNNVFIDIFCADPIPNNSIFRYIHRMMITSVYLVLAWRILIWNERNSFGRKLTNTFFSMFASVIRLILPLSIIRWFHKKFSIMVSKKKTHMAITNFPIYKRTKFPKEFYTEYTTVKFEGRNVLVSEHYDLMLTERYGNYMTPMNENNIHIKKRP